MTDDEAILVVLELEPVERQALEAACDVAASPVFAALQESFWSGHDGEAQIGPWLVLVSSDLPEYVFGMTCSAQAFALGRAALRSEVELHKTLLHELYRLCAKQSASGVPGARIAEQTSQAIWFAERTWQVMPAMIRLRASR